MRRWFVFTITIILILLLFIGVTYLNPSEPLPTKKVVYVTTGLIEELVYNVGREKFEIKRVIPEGAEIHNWEPTPSLIKEIQSSSTITIIFNGAGLEPWIEKLKSLSKNEFLDLSSNLELIKVDEHIDPHTWLSVKNVKRMVLTIKEALIKMDGSNKIYYEENSKNYIKELDRLDDEISEALKDYKGKKLLVQHDFLRYFSKDYGLDFIPVLSVEEEEPSPRSLAQIAEIVKQNKIKAILIPKGEELGSLIDTFVKDLNLKTIPINSLENLKYEDIIAGKGYVEKMRENLKSILEALSND